MSSKCYSFYMHLAKLEGETRQDIFVPIRCKSWNCPECRQIKARLVMDFIRRSFAGRPLWMLTFTCYHRGQAINAWRRMGPRWNVIRTWLTKNYPGLKYCRVIEPHKKGGWPHMHVLVDQPVSEPKMRSMLKQWGFGYIYDQSPFAAEGAAHYLSGYLTKHWPEGLADQYRRETKTRIVQASQSLGPIFSRPSSWKLVSREIPIDDVRTYVWDRYKELFINHKSGARMRIEKESFVIESVATRVFKMQCHEIESARPPTSIEEAESPSLKMIGIQQTLLPPP